LKATKQFRDYDDASQDPIFSKVITLDLATVVSSLSGPKRPHDRIVVSEMKEDFEACLVNKVN
jgi:aconitate hydratase